MVNRFTVETQMKALPAINADSGDVFATVPGNDGIIKAYAPEYLYNPPFGYPRPINVPLIRQLSRNPYIYAINKAIGDEAASAKFDIVYKEDVEKTPELEELRKNMLRFFQNPNRNKESFQDILRQTVKDIVELDSGIWVKVFNQKGNFVQMFAKDGGAFLKNPDVYGYIGDRAERIEPDGSIFTAKKDSQTDYAAAFQRYSSLYKQKAAYFQYSQSIAALPVPFGRREVVYHCTNPRTDSMYGLSPVQILGDVITTLVFGTNYNLDFYMNNNMPEGIITLLGANDTQIKAFRERFGNVIRTKDQTTGFTRKLNFRIPITNQQATFTPFQLDPKTMQVLEQQQWFTKIVWMCYGVNADYMGFTETSNKSVGDSQLEIYKRKACKPILQAIKYRIDNEIIPEWGPLAYDSFEFQWDEYNLDEDLKKHQLLQLEIQMGIKTPEMAAEELGIDWKKVQETKKDYLEDQANELSLMTEAGTPPQEKAPDNKPPAETKSIDYESELEKELVNAIQAKKEMIMQALDKIEEEE